MILPAPIPKINIAQLEKELNAAGVPTRGLSMLSQNNGSAVFHTYDINGLAIDFDPSIAAILQTVVASHKPSRPATDMELIVAYIQATPTAINPAAQRVVSMMQDAIPRMGVAM